jgi:hypothetical protein
VYSLLEPFDIVGFHAAVLGLQRSEVASDTSRWLQTSSIEKLLAEKFLAFAEIANNPLRQYAVVGPRRVLALLHSF